MKSRQQLTNEVNAVIDNFVTQLESDREKMVDIVIHAHQMSRAPGGSLGGPLHVFLEDGDYNFVTVPTTAYEEGSFTPYVLALAEQISELAESLSHAERAIICELFYHLYNSDDDTP